jgi:hypothetical protein
MILKRYGNSFQSVVPNFNPRALTEIAFRRDHAFSIPTGEFEEAYEKVDEHSVTAETEGDVHDEAEQALMKALEQKVAAAETGLDEGEVLVLESQEGEDYPKTRDRKKKVIEEGENRLYFYWWVEPPLRLGVYRKTG